MSDSRARNELPTVLDNVSVIVGRLVAWLTLFMVLVTFVVVVMRYLFDAGAVWLQESVIWMHAVVFMVGAAFTLQQDEHVRVDIFYRNMSERWRAWTDLLGVVLFLIPVCVFLAWKAWDFVLISWQLREASREPGGMPYPFVPLLKSVLLLAPLLLSLQGIALFWRALVIIRRQ